ncbi:MAG: MASE3 domain-containing protein [Sulfuricella sp.]|nr:MASE3 domain-containing protein [Sulfuricella sp.]
MKPPGKLPEKHLVTWLVIALAVIAATALLLPHHFTLGLARFLPLHTAMEAFTIVVAMLVFTVGVSDYAGKTSANLILLSCAFLVVGLLDFGHTLSYAGMPDFVTASGPEKAIHFWLAARVVAALALLAIAVLPWQREEGTRRLQTAGLTAALMVVAAVYWLILFHQDILPRVFDPATGLTPFKRGMEYFIVGIYALTAVIFYRHKQTPQPYDAGMLFAAVAVAGLSELFFAAYSEVTDLTNLLGHVYKVIAYYLLYRAVFAHSIRRPYRLLFKSEQSLRESEGRLMRILEGSADGFWDRDLTTGTVEYSGRWAEMLGYRPEEIAPQSDVWETRIHPDDRERVLKSRADYLAGLSPRYDAEFRMRAKSGEWRWIRSRGKITLRDAEGKPLRISGAHTDITEQKSAAENLALVKRQNEMILNATGEGICGVDAYGTIIFANPAAARILGYSVTELFGRSLHGTSHHTKPDGSPYPAADCPILASLNNGMVCHEGDEFYWRKDGSIFPVEYTSTPIIDEGETIGAVVMFSDITRRRQAEESLRHWQQFVEHAAWGMAIGDFESRTIGLVNPAYAHMHGYRTEEIVGMSAWELYAPESRSELPRLHEALKKARHLSFECARLRKDGSTFPALVDIAILYDAQGKAESYIANVQDITERKRAQQQLRELSAHLQTVREEEKASIAREIHDDLGGTLTALKMDVYWLARKLPAAKEMVPLLARVESMSGLLDSAVTAARRIITELRPTMLDDLGLLAALEWQCGQFHKRTGIECRVVGSENRGDEGGLDRTRSINLFRIFQEALTNVSRHSEASRVEVEFHHGDDEIILSISDNGRGLPEGHTASPTSYGMRGMSERVEHLGGRIKFDSPPGGGLRVTVRLPLPADGKETGD